MARSVGAFCERLNKVGGFKIVLPPLAMRNSVNAVVLLLVFCFSKSRSHSGSSHQFSTDIELEARLDWCRSISERLSKPKIITAAVADV